MKKNQLGITDITVSQIGLGTVKFGRNQGVRYPKQFELPTDEEIIALLTNAKNLGINLLDTAPAYGNSEIRLGKLLTNRKDWIISTKVGEQFIDGESSYDFSAIKTRISIEQSLKNLNTDYLDIVLVHSNGDDKKIISEEKIFEVLREFKQAGKIRAFGMSTKTIEGGKLTIEQSDVAMVTYNPVQSEDKMVIDYAHKNQKGIFIKKGLASGHLENFAGDNPVKTAIDFIFKEKGVTSLIVGTLNAKHLEQIVGCLD